MKSIDKLKILSYNLWYTWHPNGKRLMHPLETYIRKYRQSAAQTLSSLPDQAVMSLLKDRKLDDLIGPTFDDFNAYMNQKTWFDRYAESHTEWLHLQENPIAYFSLEFGLVDWLQMYSGGLGILAADTLKAASDHGLPFIGMSLLYRHGYFVQSFSWQGEQDEFYPLFDPLTFPLIKVTDDTGKPITVSVKFDGHTVYLEIWKLQVGRTILYYLDSYVDQNSEEDKIITGYLYGGDKEMRIKQEIILGIGGKRALEAMNITPSIYHLNEGHSAFVVLESASHFLRNSNVSFEKALEHTRTKVVFTNHTLVAAGNDVFPIPMVKKYLGEHAKHINTQIDKIIDLGKTQQDGNEVFSMTIFAMRATGLKNAVSKLHAQIAKDIWPDQPLKAITNGVHIPTWVSPEFQKVYQRYLGIKWKESTHHKEFWPRVGSIPKEKLFHAKNQAKTRLKRYLEKEYEMSIHDDMLTIVWARRFAEYKRPALLLEDPDQLKSILYHPQHPVQLIFSGKAHPEDAIGEGILKRIYLLSKDDNFKDRLFFIPGYNWNKAQLLAAAADVWLNTPIFGHEASGTSGMKAAINGTLQLSVSDGWIHEAGLEKVGWILKDQPTKKLAQTIYTTLEKEIVPLYYKEKGLNYGKEWAQRMTQTISITGKQFNAGRMLHQYVQEMYLPAIMQQTPALAPTKH